MVNGPGGTLWGPNAMNGVINIITKHAGKTTGGLLSGGGGSTERAFGSARYGTRVGDNAWLRVFGKGFNRNTFQTLTGANAYDRWSASRSGMRLDWAPDGVNEVTVSSETYRGRSNTNIYQSSLTPPFGAFYNISTDLSGGFVLANWKHALAGDDSFQVQTYFDRTIRSDMVLGQQLNTWDIEAQHDMHLGKHHFTWGAGSRIMHDRLRNPGVSTFAGRHQRQSADQQPETGGLRDGLALACIARCQPGYHWLLP